MRKDITKKFLMREDRYAKKMLSKEIVSFIARRKINIDVKQIGYDAIEFRNVFSTQFTKLNIRNILESGYKIKEVLLKDGKIIEFDMVYCDKGTFTMGADDPKDKNPKKQVEIEKPFLLGETEVTQELYEFVMKKNPSLYREDKYPNSSQRPMDNVTWYDAIMFCNKLSELLGKNPYYEIKNVVPSSNSYYSKLNSIEMANIGVNPQSNGFRLPLSKEWENAARAGTNNQYAGTSDENKLGEYAWYRDNSNWKTHPVKQKKPNEWGFYDMIGNVYEWCWDKNPNNENESQHMIRGGCYLSDAQCIQKIIFMKSGLENEDRFGVFGFRIARNFF